MSMLLLPGMLGARDLQRFPTLGATGLWVYLRQFCG
jgi:hypothetical protein